MRPNPGRLRAGQLEDAFLRGETDTAHRSALSRLRREVQADAAVPDALSMTRRIMCSLAQLAPYEVVVVGVDRLHNLVFPAQGAGKLGKDRQNPTHSQ
jgi:hypothetical protein